MAKELIRIHYRLFYTVLFFICVFNVNVRGVGKACKMDANTNLIYSNNNKRVEPRNNEQRAQYA